MMVNKHFNIDAMKNQRRKFTSEFKSRVVLEAITERLSLGELAEKFDLDANQIAEWKKKFLSKAHLVFELEDSGSEQNNNSVQETNDDL